MCIINKDVKERLYHRKEEKYEIIKFCNSLLQFRKVHGEMY